MANSKERYARIAMDSKGQLRDAWKRFVKGWQEIDNYETNIKQSDRLIGKMELDNLLRDNVCEIVFIRRRPERAPGRPTVRRMICTKCLRLLKDSINSRSFNYFDPKTLRRMDEYYHDIVVVWDVLQQNYRNVSISTPESPAVSRKKHTGTFNTCYLRQTIPADDTFWKYYNDKLFTMSRVQKLSFMDSVR